MSLRLFQQAFDASLAQHPLPNDDEWVLQPLHINSVRDNDGWFEVLYRSKAAYQCKGGHSWNSSWTMILFRVNLDRAAHFGRARMKRFGQRCNKCNDDEEFHVGMCDDEFVWYIVQCVLLHILQKCYERRPTRDLTVIQYIIPISSVRNGKQGGMPHKQEFCEACAADRCQRMYKALTGKSTNADSQ